MADVPERDVVAPEDENVWFPCGHDYLSGWMVAPGACVKILVAPRHDRSGTSELSGRERLVGCPLRRRPFVPGRHRASDVPVANACADCASRAFVTEIGDRLTEGCCGSFGLLPLVAANPHASRVTGVSCEHVGRKRKRLRDETLLTLLRLSSERVEITLQQPVLCEIRFPGLAVSQRRSCCRRKRSSA